MLEFKKLVVRYLKNAIEKIEADSCELTEAEAMDILKVIAHEPLSKEQACNFLNLSRSRFDELVRQKKIPKGRKRAGFKELVFYKDELDAAVKRVKDGKEKW